MRPSYVSTAPRFGPSLLTALLLLTTACFAVRANAEPGVMPRVLELFAKRNLVPTRFHSVVEANDSLVIDIQMEKMSARDGKMTSWRQQRRDNQCGQYSPSEP